jgi:hypothetical protein
MKLFTYPSRIEVFTNSSLIISGNGWVVLLKVIISLGFTSVTQFLNAPFLGRQIQALSVTRDLKGLSAILLLYLR